MAPFSVSLDELWEAATTEAVIFAQVELLERDACSDETATPESLEAGLTKVISYDTTPSTMLVTVTTAPSGKSEPSDDSIASAKYDFASSSSVAFRSLKPGTESSPGTVT
jgi:hypothetical protein